MGAGTGQDQRDDRRRRAAARAELRRERAAAMRRHPSARPRLGRQAGVPPPPGRNAGPGDVTPPTYGPGMERDTRTGTDDLPTAPPGRAAGVGGRRPLHDVVEQAAQQPLPFDDEAEAPIPFTLTARARRAVAPHALPSLAVVPDLRAAPVVEEDGAVDVPGDTRAARARALRRAGLGTGAIARQLQVDELLVRAWVGDPATSAVPPAVQPTVEAADDEEATALALVRAAAADEARALVRSDPGFAAGLGLLAALVSTDEHAVTLTTSRPAVAARAIAWLHERAGVQPGDVRVVLRLGSRAAGDLVRHRWAEQLGVPVGQVVHTRWRGAPAPEAAEALVRVADPELAATLAGWCDGLLDPHGHDPADVAF
jgi:hypothetical protein